MLPVGSRNNYGMDTQDLYTKRRMDGLEFLNGHEILKGHCIHAKEENVRTHLQILLAEGE